MATTNKGIYYPDDYAKPADVPNDMKKMAESIDKAIDDIPEYDDTETKEDLSEIQQNIADIQEEQDTQNTKIAELEKKTEQLQNALITEETEEETSIHVEDAAELPAKLEVRGNHTQRKNA